MTVFKTPRFWYDPAPSLKAKALTPLSALYKLGHKLNPQRIKQRRAAMKVICIGNITAGGAGKTPTTLALLELINAHKIALKPHVLTRGYGGHERGPSIVDLKKHSSRDVGDESLLLARSAPTIVARDRHRGAILAAEKGADLLVMDDGLQNRSLMKDFSFVVIDGESGFGNKRLLPAGPLREPLTEGLAKAGAFILIGEDKHNTAAQLPTGVPVLKAQITPQETLPADQPYLAFAGLGRPGKFRTTLESMGANLKAWREFSDHHAYSDEDMQALLRDADALSAKLITTEKDYVRIPETFQSYVQTLPVRLTFEDPNEVVALLSGVLQ